MPGTAKPRVMLVEDDPGVLKSLGKTLLAAGYVVIPAANGAEAVRLWEEGRGGDLVVLDMFMPEMDGLETITALRIRSPYLPIIAISGGGTEQRFDILDQAELLGADQTFRKPFDPHALLAAISRYVDRARGEGPD